MGDLIWNADGGDKIRASRFLEKTQIEKRSTGKKVIDYFRLNLFILIPLGSLGKNV